MEIWLFLLRLGCDHEYLPKYLKFGIDWCCWKCGKEKKGIRL